LEVFARDGYADLDWGNSLNATATTPIALQELAPYAIGGKVSAETPIKPTTNPKAIRIVVAGGKIQTTWFAADFRFGKGTLIEDWK
jgi:hypothetical protein